MSRGIPYWITEELGTGDKGYRGSTEDDEKII